MNDENRIIRGPDDADNRVIIPQERVISRNAGCWNCIHARDAADYWKEQRQNDLQRAVRLAIESPLLENDPNVVNIRRWVHMIDQAVPQRAMLLCKTGLALNGDPITPLVANSYMCSKWTAAQGASLARQGERINNLMDEVRDKIDGTPTTIAALTDKMKDGDQQ